MPYFDDQLHQLAEQVAHASRLEARLRELRQQHDVLSAHVRELEELKLSEQADVDRLEGRSLTAFYYNVIGKMDEKLDKERQEAYTARVKYDTALRELERTGQDVTRCHAELEELRGCEERYEAALREKAQAVKAAGGAAAEQLLDLEARFATLAHQKKELEEAIFAGRSALHTTEEILHSLGNAEDWGTFDLMGGGIVADMVKHSELDDAQEKVELLQSQLRRFKTELADVEIRADMQVSIDGFLRFADYFFDGLFTDWTVMEEISQSQVEVENTQNQIQTVLGRLEAMDKVRSQEQRQLKAQMDALVLDAPL